jgi:glycosyltransferase 2 family protein
MPWQNHMNNSQPETPVPTPAPTQPSRRSLWYLVFTILLAALLLYLALKGVSWVEMVSTLQRGHPEYLVLSFTILTVTILTRALRWGVLVSAEKPVNAITMFYATSIGYMGNQFLPARAGEVIRSVMLGRATDIPTGYILATALTERILDVVILVLVSLVVLPVLPGMPVWFGQAMLVMGLAGVTALIILFTASRFSHFYQRVLKWIPMPDKLRETIQKLIDQFIAGTRALNNPGRAARFLGLTVVIWLLDSINVIMVGRMLELTISLPQAFIFLVALGLSSALPSTPGYVGIYQFVAVSFLPIFGITRSQALTFILAFQANSIITIGLWGLVGLWKIKK